MEVVDQGFGKSNSIMLLNEIEAIGKALCLDNKPSKRLISSPTGKSRSVGKTQFLDPKPKPTFGSGGEEGLQKEKKSIWSWKPLKAFSRKRRFKCSFYVHVHSIEGLPSGFNGASFRVHWKRQDGELVTGAAKVSWGVAEFEERLVHVTSVHGSRNGPNRSAMYQAKQCLLYAKMVSLPELSLGKHRVDLTRLLPLTFEELEGDKSSGKWGTSYKLSGKAAGAVMNVSFGYSLIADIVRSPNRSIPNLLNNPKQRDDSSTMRRSESLPNVRSQESSPPSQSVQNAKDLHVVTTTPKSDLASSVITLYKKFDEDQPVTNRVEPVKPDNPPPMDSSNIDGCEDIFEFSVTEQGIELPSSPSSSKAQGRKGEEATSEEIHDSVVKPVEAESSTRKAVVDDHEEHVEAESSVGKAVVDDHEEHVEAESSVGKAVVDDHEEHVEAESSVRKAVVDDHEEQDENSKANELCTRESIMKELESALKNVTSLDEDLESLGSLGDEEGNTDIESDAEIRRDGKSLSFNDVTESEFLKMLGIEDSPTSSGSESERHKDTRASTSSLFAVETDDEDIGVCVQDASSGSSSEILADTFGFPSMAHTADQMDIQEAKSSNTRVKALEDLETEALMCEYGFNENAFHFSPPKSLDRLGSSVGSTIDEHVESLPPLGRGLGSFLQTKGGGFVRSMNPSLFRNAKGAGSLIMQVSAPVVVPAEMGNGIMEILQRLASAGVEKLSMQASKLMPLEDITGKTIQQVAREVIPTLEGQERQCGLLGIGRKKYNPSLEYVTLEDLAPLAMDKMEALSIEGLRIQSGMSGDEEPSCISCKPPLREVLSFQNKGSTRNSRGSIGLGVAVGLQLLDVREGGRDKPADDGLMGLSLTLDEWMKLDSGEMGDEDEISERTTKILAAHHATKIHRQSKGEKKQGERSHGLLGNNFTVALRVQLRDPSRNYEPVGVPMLSLVQVERLQKAHSSVSTTEIKEANKREEEAVPQFKITKVHVAGLKAEPGKKVWGSSNQQQSGSRWLLANGMGKNNKSPFLKSRTVSKSPSSPAMTMVQPGESLWSISSQAHNTHKRNPNVIFRSETIRLS